MALEDIIRQGGTNIPSPIQRFLQTKQLNAQLQQSALQRMAAQQQIQAFPEQQRRAAELQREQILTSQKARTARPKGTRRNILIPGVEGIQPGIERKGEIFSPTTGERIPSATLAPSRQETGGPGTLTSSQLGKEKLEFEEAQIGLSNSVQGIDDIMKFVSSDDFIGGISGDIVSTANSLSQQIAQLTGRASIINPETGTLDESVFSDKFSQENRSRFRRAAQLDDRVDSATLELAFVFARELNPDGRISDADVRQAEKILRQGADKESNTKTLRDVQKRMVRRFNNRAKVKGREGTTLEGILGAPTEPTGNLPQDAATQFIQESGLF